MLSSRPTTITVIICTHNPRRDYLERTLAALKAQALDVSQWDLLIVDNNSDEPLKPEGLVDWHPRGRVVWEEQPGLDKARLRGISETIGDLLLFVDDDNILSSDYLQETLRISHDFLVLGSWGAGIIAPEFEHSPEEHLKPHLDLLALRDVPKPFWSCYKEVRNLPWGAGMVLRRQMADSFAQHFKSLKSKQFFDATRSFNFNGKNSSSPAGSDAKLNLTGGRGWFDNEMAFHCIDMGSGLGIFPSLKIIHLIPKTRLDDDYLVDLACRYGLAWGILHYVHHGKKPWRQRLPRLNAFRRIAASLNGRVLSFRIEEAWMKGDIYARNLVNKVENGQASE